mmetsp:Transcript_49696/g.155511  ORF Transcript_49696/g.155511 Transcript_49696/m.155511 type:complete len:197 (+) Transcript_49696:206-796(+)
MRSRNQLIAAVACTLLCSALILVIIPKSLSISLYMPPKSLPVDGNYPGGTTGIPIDGYWPLETSHGATPYFGDPTVVTSPNVLDFSYNPAGARRRSRNQLRRTFLSQLPEGEARATQMYDESDDNGEVDMRADAACWHCAKSYQGNPYAMYTACADICLAADCVERCEQQYSAHQYGPTAPDFLSRLCAGECRRRF